MNQVTFQGRVLEIDGNKFTLDHKIREARLINDLAIVIYEFDNSAPRHQQFQNCKAFDSNGNLVWTAEHPTNETADSYVEFLSGEGNRLWNFSCFICELDFKAGRLNNAIFTK